MILFTTLTLILLILIVFTVITVSAVGAVGIILFGDVIVCAVLIAFVIKKLVDRKRREV